jgi:hypothetical protein
MDSGTPLEDGSVTSPDDVAPAGDETADAENDGASLD